MTNQEIILDMIAGNFDEYINEVDNLRRRNIEMGNELEYQEKVAAPEIGLLRLTKNYIAKKDNVCGSFAGIFDENADFSVVLDKVSKVVEKVVNEFCMELECDLEDCFWENQNLNINFDIRWKKAINEVERTMEY